MAGGFEDDGGETTKGGEGCKDDGSESSKPSLVDGYKGGEFSAFSVSVIDHNERIIDYDA